jgi:hypothetical protein
MALRFRDTVVGKYGCSDARYDNLGAASYLMWNERVDAKLKGAMEYDLGRTESGDQGSIPFEDRWASTRTDLVYWRYPTPLFAFFGQNRNPRIAKSFFGFLPQPLLKAVERVLYHHLG